LIPSGSCQFEQIIVNKVLVVPFRGLIEQEPFWGASLIRKFNALEVVSVENE